jgi:hypothetical protein
VPVRIHISFPAIQQHLSNKLFFHQSDISQPIHKSFGPTGNGTLVAFAYSKAMPRT